MFGILSRKKNISTDTDPSNPINQDKPLETTEPDTPARWNPGKIPIQDSKLTGDQPSTTNEELTKHELSPIKEGELDGGKKRRKRVSNTKKKAKKSTRRKAKRKTNKKKKKQKA